MATSGPVPESPIELPEPKPLDQYLRELYAAKQERRRQDAALPFEEKIEIVLELQEASRLVRESAGTGRPPRTARDRTQR
jgi:hypothetical protein